MKRFKKGDKVKYLGHPGIITHVEDRNGKIYEGSSSSKCLVNVKGDKIYEGSSTSKCLANMRGDRLYEGSSTSKCIANTRSGNVYEGSSTSKKLNTFDGHNGSITQWALWYLFCK